MSEVALGVSLFGTTGYGATADDARTILDSYIDAGGNFVDTSSRYRFGESEAVLGELLVGRRDEVILATKFSCGDGPHPPLANLGGNRLAMVRSVEQSLTRLKTDRIDLLYVHTDDRITPIEETLRGLDDLVRAGKIVYGGFSNYPAWRLSYGFAIAQARGWAPMAGIQIEYSAIQRSPERDLLPMADACGLGVVCWSPLAGGLLTGKYRRGETGRGTAYAEAVPQQDRGVAADVITAVLEVAAEVGDSPSRVALAWLLAKGATPLIGPRTPHQLADNLGALAITLDAGALERIDKAGALTIGYPDDLTLSAAQRASVTGGRQDLIDVLDRPVL